MLNVIFVCMGNICRSPSGEAVFKAIVEKNNLEEKIFVDSAGTIGYHAGERADSRMRQHAALRGYKLDSIARKFIEKDFDKFDYIIAMDRSNYSNILALDKAGKYSGKVSMMTDYCTKFTTKEVPDPYYGGAAGFELVLDLLEDACTGLLNKISEEHPEIK